MKKTTTTIAKARRDSRPRAAGKTLHLHHETVRILTGVDLSLVAGGIETQVSREPNGGVC
jgi:hypothetical protein